MEDEDVLSESSMYHFMSRLINICKWFFYMYLFWLEFSFLNVDSFTGFWSLLFIFYVILVLIFHFSRVLNLCFVKYQALINSSLRILGLKLKKRYKRKYNWQHFDQSRPDAIWWRSSIVPFPRATLQTLFFIAPFPESKCRGLTTNTRINNDQLSCVFAYTLRKVCLATKRVSFIINNILSNLWGIKCIVMSSASFLQSHFTSSDCGSLKIPVEHLEYDYIDKCKDAKYLEKILILLR